MTAQESDRRLSNKGISILLTATINTRATVFVQRRDERLRFNDYKLALLKWIATPGISQIIFCENSGYDIGPLIDMATEANRDHRSIVFVSYESRPEEGARGKGYCELGLISHVIHSMALSDGDRFLKVTGRYYVRNILSVIRNITAFEDADVLSCPIISIPGHIRGQTQQWVASECFYCSVTFLRSFFLPRREEIDDTLGVCFEHILASAISSAANAGLSLITFDHPPELMGISGTDNLPRLTAKRGSHLEVGLSPDYVKLLINSLERYIHSDTSIDDIERSEARDTLMAIGSAFSLGEFRNVLLGAGAVSTIKNSFRHFAGELGPEVFARTTGISVATARRFVNLLAQSLNIKERQLCLTPNALARRSAIEMRRDSIVFRGYQEFELTRTSVRVLDTDPLLDAKRRLLAPYFTPVDLEAKTILDLGANHGFFCFWAILNGARTAVAVEMDATYLGHLQDACAALDYNQIVTHKGRIERWTEAADIVLALALVHWIYSCTATYGSIDRIIQKLARITKRALFIEWIDPEDPAIGYFHHVKWNDDLTDHAYSIQRFEIALAKHFVRWSRIGEVAATRVLYVGYHYR